MVSDRILLLRFHSGVGLREAKVAAVARPTAKFVSLVIVVKHEIASFFAARVTAPACFSFWVFLLERTDHFCVVIGTGTAYRRQPPF